MALSKNITLDNGVTVKYHRIVSILHIINDKTIIETASYTSQEKREEEKQAIENGTEMNVYIKTEHIPTEYNTEMTINNAYEYLLTLPKYKKATSIWEGLADEQR